MKLLKLAGLSPLLCIALSGCGGNGGGDGLANMDCAPGATPAVESSKDELIKGAQVHPSSLSAGTNRFLVKMRPLAPGEIRANSLPQNAKPAVDTIDNDWKVVELKEGADPAALVQELMSMDGVAEVEPDFVIQASGFLPNDPGLSRQWAHRKVSSRSAWGLSQGSNRVVVAIVDGGVETTHPDLAANIWHNPREVRNGRDDDGNGYVDDMVGWDFIGRDADPRADSSSHIHGTHVAGIIGAVGNNGRGIVGQAPNVKLMSLKYIGSDGTGFTSNAIRAIDYAVRNGAHIINASWSSTSYSKALYDAIVRARAAGVLVVAASGNDGVNIDQRARYPASFGLDNIVTVGASTNSDNLASFSNRGVKNVDLLAPGTSIYSTRTGGAYSLLGGTSMAAPLVTGIAALVKSRHFGFNYRKIAGALFLGVDRFSSLSTRVRFSGRANAHKTLLASDDLANGRTVMSQSLLCPGS